MVAPAMLFFLMIALLESLGYHLLKAHWLESDRHPDRLRIVKQYDEAFHSLRRLRHTKFQAARDLYTIDIWLRMNPPQPSGALQNYPAGEGLKSRLKVWFPTHITLLKVPSCRRAMTSGPIVLSLQQLCGVNAFTYYSSSVFRDSLTGSTSPLGLNATSISEQRLDRIALGVRTPETTKHASVDIRIILVRFRCNKFWPCNRGPLLIDTVGRRLLLVLTILLMSAFQFGIAFSFGTVSPARYKWCHTPVVLFAYLFCVVNSIGEGAVPLVSGLSFSLRQLLTHQVYASEIPPLEVRDTGKLAYVHSKLKILSYRRGQDTHCYLLGYKRLDGLDLASNVRQIKPRREFLLFWGAEPDRLDFGHAVSTSSVHLIK